MTRSGRSQYGDEKYGEPAMASKSRDNVSKINDSLRTIAAVLVPIVVAILGVSYNSAISNRETAVRFVELAIDILRENPEEGAQNRYASGRSRS